MKYPLAIVYCTCKDEEFKECPDGSLIRAVGNISPDFPDESLYIKHCKLAYKKQGECSHQVTLDRIPRIPAYFYKGMEK